MNIPQLTIKKLLAATFLFALVLQSASAFYDPGVQRWLNRDPVQELGGRNLFTFVRNSPPQRLDRFGHSPPVSSAGEKLDCIRDCGPVKARKASKLAEKAAAETRKRYPNANGDDDYADAFRHCFWACTMAREVGEECAEKVLNNHESANDKGGQNERSGEMDRENNQAGLNLADEKGDCGDLCKKALEDGSLVKRPADLGR